LQSENEEAIQQTIHGIELGLERVNADSEFSAADVGDAADAPPQNARMHRKKSKRASGK
jgi:hypothetical protein